MTQINSFGRKIKDCFSVTFKKDEDMIKIWLNEQVSPVSYIKQLILNDMKSKEENCANVNTNTYNSTNHYSNFNFNMED